MIEAQLKRTLATPLLCIKTTRPFHYCDEFLVHAVDVEGKAGGIEEDIAALLGNWDGISATYAGGVSSFEDLRKLKELCNKFSRKALL